MTKTSSRSFVVLLPGGKEHFVEAIPWKAGYSTKDWYKDICEEAVRKKGLKTSRKNPQKVAVELFALEINQGELKRRKVGNYEVMPPMERMSSEEYEESLQEALDDLPQEFQEYIRNGA